MNQKLIYKYGHSHHFNLTTFPDGQQNVELDMTYWIDRKKPVDIECSIRNWKELEVLLCLIGALQRADFVVGNVNFWYLFGLRSDRVFEAGMPNYVEDVLVPILKTIQDRVGRVGYFMPHGRTRFVLPGDRLRLNAEIVPEEIFNMMLVAADESALPVIHPDPNITEYQTPYFRKVRTNDTLSVMLSDQHKDVIKNSAMAALIADDMCDGGATFIAEAKYLREEGIVEEGRPLNLFVQHGLFSKGLDELAKYFNTIYVTNSYQEIDHPQYKVLEVI